MPWRAALAFRASKCQIIRPKETPLKLTAVELRQGHHFPARALLAALVARVAPLKLRLEGIRVVL